MFQLDVVCIGQVPWISYLNLDIPEFVSIPCDRKVKLPGFSEAGVFSFLSTSTLALGHSPNQAGRSPGCTLQGRRTKFVLSMAHVEEKNTMVQTQNANLYQMTKDGKKSNLSTAVPPAHHPDQVKGTATLTHQWPAGVPLWRTNFVFSLFFFMSV